MVFLSSTVIKISKMFPFQISMKLRPFNFISEKSKEEREKERSFMPVKPGV